MARQLGCRCAELPGLTAPWLFVHLNPLCNIPFPCSVSLTQPARGAAFHTQSCDLYWCWEHSWLSLPEVPSLHNTYGCRPRGTKLKHYSNPKRGFPGLCSGAGREPLHLFAFGLDFDLV